MNDRKLSAFSVQRSAFTLVEMLVSLAVIVVALAVVVTAFTITTRTARQAAAYTEVQGWVRQFTSQIQEDLSYCEPSQSILVLVGRTQEAALTDDDLTAQRRLRFLVGDPDSVQPPNYDPIYAAGLDTNREYSDPRADILMFFTNRPTVSQAPATDPNPGPTTPTQMAIADGARLSPIQVVYGHAARGQTTVPQQPNDPYAWLNTPGSLTHIGDETAAGLSQLPAGAWHLTRRVAIPAFEVSQGTDIPNFNNEMGRLVRCQPLANKAGDVVDFDFTEYLRQMNVYVEVRPQHSAYGVYNAGGNVQGGAQFQTAINEILYADPDPAKRHVATVLDRPPVDLRTNLGVHMLPGCAWFQVEFLMPEDARNGLDYDPPTPTENPPALPTITQRNKTPRWTQIDPDETYVFLPDTPENRVRVARERWAEFSRVNPGFSMAPAGVSDFDFALPNIRVRLWPYAIRVTVRAYDPRGRLPEPILRSLVHRFD